MERTSWSVRLLVDDATSGPLSGKLMQAMGGPVHSISIADARSIDDDDEAAAVTFELAASTGGEARILAQHLLGEVQAAAGLEVHEAPVVWVAPLASSAESSSHRFLDQANDLLAQELPELAVVAAQIHLELQVNVLVRRAVVRDGSPVAAALVRDRRAWGPHERWARPILEAFFGIDVATFPRWADYLAHVKRRNAVVHDGQEVDQKSAEESVRVVEEIWLWLNAAATEERSRDGTRRPREAPTSSQALIPTQLALFDPSAGRLA